MEQKTMRKSKNAIEKKKKKEIKMNISG